MWKVKGPEEGDTKTVNGVEYIYLADGKWWTHYVQGTATTWSNAASLCPSGSHLPTAIEASDLILAYGGYYTNQNASRPYFAAGASIELHEVTGWDTRFWTSTRYATWSSNDSSYTLVVENSSGGVGGAMTNASLRTVCLLS